MFEKHIEKINFFNVKEVLNVLPDFLESQHVNEFNIFKLKSIKFEKMAIENPFLNEILKKGNFEIELNNLNYEQVF